ncbi:MAG: hypothetical protein ACJAW3_000947 [Lentimonas sp.]|jgi:hypothetical protein
MYWRLAKFEEKGSKKTIWQIMFWAFYPILIKNDYGK